jgi:hypothetical protein
MFYHRESLDIKIQKFFLNVNKNYMLNTKLNFKDISRNVKENKIFYVDNFLTEETAFILRERMLNKTRFDEYYFDYQSISYYDGKDKITNKLANEISKKIKTLDKFERAWSFIYDNQALGVNFHADPSSININIWVSKNESVQSFEENGLEIINAKPPSDWTRDQWNGNKDNCIIDFLKNHPHKIKKIKYKYNRAIFFDGAYFHKTDNVNMKPGLKNRRVSYTMLFGKSLNEKS